MNCETKTQDHRHRHPHRDSCEQRAWDQAEAEVARWVAQHPQAWDELQRLCALMVATPGTSPLAASFLTIYGRGPQDMDLLREFGLRWMLVLWQAETRRLED